MLDTKSATRQTYWQMKRCFRLAGNVVFKYEHVFSGLGDDAVMSLGRREEAKSASRASCLCEPAMRLHLIIII